MQTGSNGGKRELCDERHQSTVRFCLFGPPLSKTGGPAYFSEPVRQRSSFEQGSGHRSLVTSTQARM